MPLDAPTAAGEPAPPPGTADAFRLLTARLKRSAQPQPRPVAQEEAPPPPAPEPDPPHALPPDPREAAAALLDIVWGAVDLPPQERSMAGDTLLILLPQLSGKDLAMLAERVAAIKIWAWSWHTPRPSAKASAAVVWAWVVPSS